MPTIEIQGDVHIRELTDWKNEHYRIHGNLVIHSGGVLFLDHVTVELMNTYSREFNYLWDGGTVISTGSTLGGTVRNGTNVQSNMELRHGEWYCTDTTVRYCNGIVVGTEGHVGRLRAVRLTAGPNADSVLMTGKGDAVIKDSNYMICLFLRANSEAQASFNLPIQTPVSQVFDGSNVPGAQYRLELVNTSVPLWFLFAQDVTMEGPRVVLNLRYCPWLVAAVIGKDLQGCVHLPSSETTPKWDPELASVLPAGVSATTGNVTWNVLDGPVRIPGWGVYLQGDKTDLMLTGPTYVCELMVWAGKASLIGDEKTYNAVAAATTIEVGDFSVEQTSESVEKKCDSPPVRAELLMRNVTIGRIGAEDSIRGQVSAHGGGTIIIEHARCADLLLMTKGDGTIGLADVRREGKLEVKRDGGTIKFIGEEK